MARSRVENVNVAFGLGIWAILLVFTALLAFSPDVGVPGVLDAMNLTDKNFAKKVGDIQETDLAALCDEAFLDGNTDCTTAARNFKDELLKLRYIHDELRPVVRAGHVWYHAFNTLGLTNETRYSTDATIAALDELSDLHDVYNTVSTVQTALIVSFVLLLIYSAAMFIEGMDYNMINSPAAKSVLYWTTHAHVFIILLLSTYVFIVSYSNDFFMDQADAVCITRTPAVPTLISVDETNKTVSTHTPGSAEQFTYDAVCFDSISDYVNSHFSMYFWIVVIFSQLYISSHFNLRHGPVDDSVEHVFNSTRKRLVGITAQKATSAKVGKRVAYAPLTSIHNR